MLIRVEEASDRAAVHSVNAAAFGKTGEADLVDALRQQARPIVSLVAQEGDAIVGHVLFTPVALAGEADRRIMGLGPLAVPPAQQRQGIGSALVHAGLQRCRELGYGAVVVLGHPAYYPRFGFAPAAQFGIACEYDVPAEAFMAVELQADSLRGAVGVVQYHAAFRSVT